MLRKAAGNSPAKQRFACRREKFDTAIFDWISAFGFWSNSLCYALLITSGQGGVFEYWFGLNVRGIRW